MLNMSNNCQLTSRMKQIELGKGPEKNLRMESGWIKKAHTMVVQTTEVTSLLMNTLCWS